jgi:hypothetical protein
MKTAYPGAEDSINAGSTQHSTPIFNVPQVEALLEDLMK